MNVIDKINAFFNSENVDLEVVEKTEEPKKEKFEEVTLVDGTVLQVEPALEVGAAAMLMVDGELAPAPDGEHVLDDNSIIVTEGGLITSVEPAAEVEEEVVEELDSEAKEPAKAEREAKKVIESIVTEKQFNELVAEVEELKKAKDFLKKDNEEIQAKYTEDFNKLGELFKELFAEPTKEPKQTIKNPLKRESKNIFLSAKKK